MKKFYVLLWALLLLSLNAFAQVYSENFDGVGATVTSGILNSGTGQPTISSNLSVISNWTSYDHLSNVTSASDVVNFCSSGKGLRGYAIPFGSATRKFKLVLNVDAGYTFNMTSISYKHTSNINNGNSKVFVNGVAYGTNVVIQQACPGQAVNFTQALSLTGQITIELVANNAGTINNAEFVFDNFVINGTVDFNANNEFIKQACIGSTSGVEARLGNAEIADFDGDNDKDIIANDDATTFRLYKNNGSGVFDAGITLFTGGLIAVGDLDGDGDMDIANSSGKIYLNNGSGVFTQLGTGIFRTSTLNIQNVKIADFNNDGKKDLLWLNASLTAGENNEIWLNTGTTGSPNFALHHSFDNNGVGPAMNSVVGDIDNDGDMDIVTCSTGGWSGRVYKNNGSGTFSISQTFNGYTGNGFLVDWDNDGDKDFLAYDGYNAAGLRLWTNDGTGVFSAPSGRLYDVIYGVANALVDLNNDGYLDIACSNWGGYGRFILNSGCVLTPQSQALSNSINGVRVADFNNDGKMDILNLARDSASCVYLNYLTTKTNVPLPTPPSVSTPINYAQNATATALTATGTNLLWYTEATGGTGSATAPTPSTTTVGTTSYWVSQTNANSCESGRAKIDVIVSGSCLGGAGNQARLYNPLSADFDGDNDKDIIVMDEGGNYWMYKNDGTGKFTSTQILNGLGWGGLDFKDLDADGDIDLVSTFGKIFLNNGLGVFTQLSGTFWTATGTINIVKIADFNKDSKQDILWFNSSHNAGFKNQLWINNGTTGNPNFILSNEFENDGVPNGGSAIGDIDNDNDIDLIVCSTGGWAGKVYKNNGSGVFTSSQTLTGYTGNGFIVDWDKDGDNDFLAFDTYNNWGLRLWTNDGTGSFSAPSATSLTDPAIGFVRQIVDLNDDNYLDIICSSPSGARYYLNSGCSLVLNVQVLNTANNSTAVDDFNNNGKKDIFCAARDAQSCLNLLNIAPTASAVTPPSVITPINYAQGATATALTATGTNLKWYTAATGGTGNTTAPTPSTATLGTTSYWVSQTINDCESSRAKIDVVVSSTVSATHLAFDGTNDFVEIAHNSNLPYSGTQFTLEAQVKLNGNQPDFAGIVSKSTSGVSVGCQLVIVANKIALEYSDGNTSLGVGSGLIGVTDLNDNRWHHLTCVVDKMANTIRLYVDGVQEAILSDNRIGGFDITNTISLKLGVERDGVVYFKGHIEEVRIWNTALSANDILRRKNCELQGNEAGLVAYYKFNQGFDASTNTTITTLTDATSNGNNGTLNNFTLTGSTSNWLAGSPVTTGSSIPTAPTVTSSVTYCQNATASALTATGTSLKWYTAATGGTSSTTAPTPSTTTAGTTSYWVTSSNANGCESERVKIDVPINPQPSAATASNQSFCVSATVANLTATGTNIKWYGTAIGGSALVSTMALTTGTTYYASQTSANGCESSRTAVVVTINSTLSTPSVSTPVLYCQNATATALTASGTNLQWFTTATGGIGNTTAPTPSTTTVGTTSYWVSQSLNGCESDRAKIDVTVNTLPAAPSVSTPISYCQNATASALTANGTSLKWYTAATGGTSSTTAPTPSTTTAGTTSYWVSQTNANGCESSRAKIDITINALPSVPSINEPALSYCQGNLILKLTATVATGETVDWYSAATNGLMLQGSSVIYTASQAGTYYAQARNISTGCVNNQRTMGVITMNATPNTPTISEPTMSYCKDSSMPKLTATVATGITIDWYSAPTSGTMLQGSTISYTPAQAGRYYAQSRNITTGCINTQRTMGEIKMNITPSLPVISVPSLSYCEGKPMPSLTVTVATGETVDWYSAATNGTMVQSTTIIFTPTQAGSFYAQSRNIATGCMSSQRVMGTVKMNILPLAAITSSPVHICEGSAIPTLNAQVQNGETVDWYNKATGGDIFFKSSVTYTPSVVGIYYAEARNINTGCVSASRIADTISIDPIPLKPTVQALLSYCVGANAPVLTATGSNLKWYATETGGAVIPTAPQPYTSQVGTISYFVTQTTGNNCESPRSKIDVTTETFKNTLPKQMNLCKDQYYVFNLKNSKYSNLKHTWTSSNGYTSNKETDTLRNSGSYFIETVTALGCKSKDTIALTLDTTTIEANFAVATELVTVDVIKVVNISSTKNDSSRWVIPSGLKVVSNTPALLELVANDTGSYKLGLITYKGGCNAVSYQDVTLYTKTFKQTDSDSLYFVKTFTAFPNPSKGDNVSVKIELSKESSVRLRLIEVSTNIIINDRTLPKADTHLVDYGSGLKKGSYILFLESPYGRNVLKIIVL